MTDQVAPLRVFYGEREAMIAEVGAWDPKQIDVLDRDCRYLVMADGAAQFDTDYCASLKDAKAIAAEIARYHGITAIRIY